MKIKVRSDASTQRKHGWPQMADWLAEVRDSSRAEPPADCHAGANGAEAPWSEPLAQTDAFARAHADARAQAEARAQAKAHAEARARTQTEVRAEATARAVIGDQLRMSITWCEMGSYISLYADPEALGEADTRARAIGAGWRIDALGRLSCSRCQQTDSGFWASCPVAPRDRYTVIAGTARAAAVPGDRTTGSAGGTSRDPARAASGYPPVGRTELEWHHNFPAAQAMPVGWSGERPPGISAPAVWP